MREKSLVTLNSRETEANHFAICLLVPRDFLKKDLDDLGYFDKNVRHMDITHLASKYNVSLGMINYALLVHGFK